nr:MAG TPA: acetyltransferase domain containing protein [Caudoviricetes sp.]
MFEIRELTYRELEQCPGFLAVATEYQQETQNMAIGNPSVQFERYRELDKLGKLKCLGAFEDGALVGLVGVTLARSQHYAFPIATMESFYLRKAHRKGANGLRLLRATKEMAKREGAPGLVIMAPPGSSYDKLCEKLGMVHTHNAYWCKA